MTAGQQAVFNVLQQYGPLNDAALVPLVQHMAHIKMSSSGIRSRRAELVADGKVWADGETKMPSGRMAVTWDA